MPLVTLVIGREGPGLEFRFYLGRLVLPKSANSLSANLLVCPMMTWSVGMAEIFSRGEHLHLSGLIRGEQ
jgi:hypothetical protein